jgi:3-methyladenine DNA glycosylase AlkD
MRCDEIITRLKAQGNPDNVAGMARDGISIANTFGTSICDLRRLAKEIEDDRELACASERGRPEANCQILESKRQKGFKWLKRRKDLSFELWIHGFVCSLSLSSVTR